MTVLTNQGRLTDRRETSRHMTAKPVATGRRKGDHAVQHALRSPPAKHFHRFYMALGIAVAALIGVNVLLILGVRTGSAYLNRQLDLAHEANIAAWFSSVLLVLAGVMALIMAWLSWLKDASPAARRLPVLAWLAVGAMMVGLSADEVAQVHEWVGNRVPHHLGAEETVLGLNHTFRWLLILAPFIIGGAALLIWFSIACLRGRDRILVIAGVACWIGTILAEYVEAVQWRNGWARGLQVPIEEGFELIGTTLIFIAFVQVLRRTLGLAAPAAEAKPADRAQEKLIPATAS